MIFFSSFFVISQKKYIQCQGLFVRTGPTCYDVSILRVLQPFISMRSMLSSSSSSSSSFFWDHFIKEIYSILRSFWQDWFSILRCIGIRSPFAIYLFYSPFMGLLMMQNFKGRIQRLVNQGQGLQIFRNFVEVEQELRTHKFDCTFWKFINFAMILVFDV